MLDTLQQFFTADLSLWGVFIASLVAATILPISSEVVLIGALKLHPELFWTVLLLATLGNTCGGMISFGMGRLLPLHDPRILKQIERVRRYGTPILLLAWLPLIGDALCLAAGWLRLNPLRAAAFMAVGKFARYAVLAWAI